MRAADFVKPVRYRALSAELARVLRLCGLLQAPPLAMALCALEFGQAAVFAGIGAGAYGLGRLGSRAGSNDLARGEALVVSALAYIVFAIAGALAFLPVTSFEHGLFEATSGFTTTGLSVLDPRALPASLVLFRAYTQWVGGAGIVVLALVVLSWPARTLFPAHAAELADKSLAGSVVATSRLVLRVYAGLTVACFATYLAVGMGWFDAVAHALSTVSTGGFSTRADSMRAYATPLVSVAVCVFMVLGATSFPLYQRLRHDGPRALTGDPQLRTLAALAVVVAVFTWAADRLAGAPEAVRDLAPHLYLAISAVTTTGFETRPMHGFGDATWLLTMLLMFVGGAAGSTAGGIKLVRFSILVRVLRDLVVRPLLPDEARIPVRYAGTSLDEASVRQTLGLALLYACILLLSALALTAAGIPARNALFECTSALGTVGLSCGVTSADLGPVPLLVLAFDMWAGRLEILAVLVLLYPSTWRRATIAA